MNVKSQIQLIRESIDAKNTLCQGLENLMEKYNIEDSVFTLYKGSIQECTKGYFVVENEAEDLKNLKLNATGNLLSCVRVMENSKFQAGSLYEKLTDCPTENKVLDLETFEYIN